MKVDVVVHSVRGGIKRIEREASWLHGGLAVTSGDRPERWSVTLVRGGRGVFTNMRDHGRAVRAAEQLLTLGDWERDEKAVLEDEALHAAAKALRDRLYDEDEW